MNQSYLIFIQGRTSSRLRVLTIISAIFLPQTFLISWYALTEKYLKAEQWQDGYPIVMVIMLISTLILALYFYKKGWFK
jgi:magnesium transporter